MRTKEEKVKLIEDCGDWLKVLYTDGKEGYVASEYVLILEEYTYAKTLTEEQYYQDRLFELASFLVKKKKKSIKI